MKSMRIENVKTKSSLIQGCAWHLPKKEEDDGDDEERKTKKEMKWNE